MVERAKRVWLSDSLEFGFLFYLLGVLGIHVSHENHSLEFPQTIHLNDEQGELY